MKDWINLALAIITETTGSLALSAATNHHPGWWALVAVGYASTFVFLNLILAGGMPIGVAYGIWGAGGVTITAIMGAVLFRDPLTPLMIAGIALVAAGVLTVESVSRRTHHSEATPS